jgi:hypothetical protein
MKRRAQFTTRAQQEDRPMSHPSETGAVDAASMTVIHAGPTLLGEPAALRSLEHYLSVCSDEHLVLVHGSRPELREIAEEAGVPEVAIDHGPRFSDEEREAASLAIELGATAVEYAIDRPSLARPGGRRVERLTVREAERFARTAALSERLREKVLAAASAVRQGLCFARIGGPIALLRDAATVIEPDPAVKVGVPASKLPLLPSEDAAPIAARGEPATEAPVHAGIPSRRPRWSPRRIVSCSPRERAVLLTPDLGGARSFC